MSRRLEWAGVTAAVKAADIAALVSEGGKPAVASYYRDLGAQALEDLRQAVGGVPLRSEPIVRIDGPTDDPLQGSIYALSVSAQVDVNELPPGCAIRLAWERHGVVVDEPGVIL